MTDEAPDGAVPDAAPAPVEPSRELALAPHRVSHEVIRPLDPGQVVESMRTHQELLRAILDESDWQGPPDAKGSFVKKSGWRKVALAYNLSMGRVGEEVERDDDGAPRRATFTVWAEAPNGRRVEATGHCSFDESRFSGPRGNVSKLENDMRATAETRAKNRAISDLIGMGKVSAEEVDAGSATQAPAMADDALQARMLKALAFTLDTGEGPNDALATQAYNRIGRRFDGIPEAAAWAVLEAAGTLKAHIDAVRVAAEQAQEPQPEVVSGEVLDPPPMTDDERADEAALQAKLANEF